jgi:outer membrane lipoprotein-sorting protein
MRLWTSVALGTLLVGPVAFGWGQAAAEPTAEQIAIRMLAKSAERTAALERYDSERIYRVEYKGTGGEHTAEMKVRLEYRAPNQKRFVVESESGSKFICDKVLKKLVDSEQEASERSARMQTVLSPQTYNMRVVGEEAVNGVPAWVMEVSPKVADKFTYKGKVWVSKDDYGVVKVVGEPAKSPSWFISKAGFEYQYGREAGRFWLPEKNVSTSHVRIGGEARLTIEYGAYHIVAAGQDAPLVASASQ